LYDLPASEAKTPAELLADNADQSGIQELTHVTELIQQGATLKDILSALQNSLESVGHSIDSVVENVTAFEEHDADFTLEHLLNELALSGRGGAPTRGGGIKVATLHRTKGLQWPEVYLAGMENDQLPDFRATSISDIAAERRLCFVGVCRAAERLVFTHASFNGGYAQSPSRFLAEMKVERM
jgi:DNA helicase-2/ATP-dependent DNA helicase PcrA